MTAKALDGGADRRVREALESIARQFVKTRPDGSIDDRVDTAVAGAIGFSQQGIQRVRKNGEGIGLDLTRAIATHYRVPMTALMDYGAPPPVLAAVLAIHRSDRWSPCVISHVMAITFGLDRVDELYDWEWEDLLDEQQKEVERRQKLLRRR